MGIYKSIGSQGPSGLNGADGVSVTNAVVNGSGHLIITLSSAATIDAGYVKGDQETQGLQGVGVQSAIVNGSDHLILTLTSGSTIDAGYVKGDTGATGAQGIQGPKGDTGEAGMTGQGVPTGGLTGQVLAKSSNTDYATTWVTPSSSGGNTLVADVVVGADATSFTLSGLDLNTAGVYEIMFAIKNNAATATNIYGVGVNGDATTANYSQSRGAMTASYSGGIGSQSRSFLQVGSITNGAIITGRFTVFKTNAGKVTIQSAVGTDLNGQQITTITTAATVANMTSLLFDSSVSLGIGAGSRFIVYKKS